MVIHDSYSNPITEFPENEDGEKVLPVMIQHNGQHMHLDAQNVAVTTGFMLISLRSTTIWKHIKTNVIHIDWIGINLNPSSAYRGDVSLGFLTNSKVGSANFNIVKTYHFDQAANGIQAFLSFLGSHLECSTEHWYGPSVANDSTFGTNISLQDPSGYFHPGCYNEDLVMKIGRTAGNIDVGVTVGYHTT